MQNALLVAGTVCSLAGGVVLWKDYSDRRKVKLPEKLDGRVYLVTGANSGIGRAIANGLASRNAKVYLVCRDMEKCEATRRDIVLGTKNKYVYCRQCDLSSFESVKTFVRQFRQKESRVDGLVNNAGIMNAPYGLSQDGIELHLATNHMGHFLLTHLLLDLLREASPSRIVFLMNLDYRKGKIDLSDLNCGKSFTPFGAFCQSQLANMLLVQKLGRRLAGTGVTCNAAYPGVVTGTAIKRHMDVEQSVLANAIAKPVMWTMARSALKGAETPLWLLLHESVSEQSGMLFSSLKQISTDDAALCPDLAKKLYLTDLYWTGLKSKNELLTQ